MYRNQATQTPPEFLSDSTLGRSRSSSIQVSTQDQKDDTIWPVTIKDGGAAGLTHSHKATQTLTRVSRLFLIQDLPQVDPYSYEPLVDSQSIRLIRINGYKCPGTNLRIVTGVDIIHTPFDQAPTYTCLSYVWGDATKHFALRLLGGKAHVPLTASLANALPDVLACCETDHLWVDQLCIRQSTVTEQDMTEKSQQVALMGEIFGKAHTTYVWLPFPDGLSSGLSLLAGSLYRKSNQPVTRHDLNHSDYSTKTVYPKSAPATRDMIQLLFDQGWFLRGWVLQEYVLCKRKRFLLGTLVLSDAEVHALSTFVKDGSHFLAFQDVSRRLEKANTDSDKALEFLSILKHCSQWLGTKIEKDRLLAYVGLWRPPSFRVQYSQSTSEIFTEFARCVAVDMQSLLFLGWPSTDGKLLDPPLPTWVPNWSSKLGWWQRLVRTRANGSQKYDASAGRLHITDDDHSRINDPDALVVRGKIVGTVVACYQLPTFWTWENGDVVNYSNTALEDVFTDLCAPVLCAPVDASPSDLTQQFMPAVYSLWLLHYVSTRSIVDVINQLGSSVVSWSTDDFLAAYEELSASPPFKDFPAYYLDRDLRAHVHDSLRLAQRNTLVLTDTGKVALMMDELASQEAEELSRLKIAVIHGCRVPIVLKEVQKNGSTCHEVVCDCCLEGAMSGESVTWSEEEAEHIVLV